MLKSCITAKKIQIKSRCWPAKAARGRYVHAVVLGLSVHTHTRCAHALLSRHKSMIKLQCVHISMHRCATHLHAMFGLPMYRSPVRIESIFLPSPLRIVRHTLTLLFADDAYPPFRVSVPDTPSFHCVSRCGHAHPLLRTLWCCSPELKNQSNAFVHIFPASMSIFAQSGPR